MATCEKEENRQAAHDRPDAPVDSTCATCPLEEEPEFARIRIRVVLFDPLADAGLYTAWGFDDIPAEIAASGVECSVTMTKKVGDSEQTESQSITVPDRDSGDTPEVIVEEDQLAPDSIVEVTLPQIQTTGNGAAWLTAHTDDGEVTVDDGEPVDEPHRRNRFRCRVDASYTIRIWLKPKTVVLHWSVTGRDRDITSRTGRCYNFRVIEEDGGAVRWCAGAHDTDPRFWRHNLHIAGVPSVPGINDVEIAIGQALGGGRESYWGGDGQTAIAPSGYARHAGGFNTNSVGVNACGMSGSTTALIDQTHAFSNAQIDELISRVADLCDAWKLDATDAHQVCTHFEVNHLHRNLTPPGKWDITWLPEEKQTAYEDASNQPLCTDAVPENAPPPANQPYRYHRYTDVELTGTFNRPPAPGDTNVKTDRVSAYFRELIAGA